MFIGLLLLAVHSAWSAPPVSPVDASLILPVLFVSGEDGVGSVGSVRLSIASRPSESLLVSITEDVPRGVGEQMRAAVWLAAVTASMERRTFLDELRIDAEIHGRVDGPSAGAALTLGLMLLLDGESWPQETAITGTVLPDGSIGMVGGVLSKLEGAQQHGLKRVLLPAGLRTEVDDQGKQVDLLQRCAALKLRCEAVGSIGEAYALLLGREAPSTSISEVRLDKELEAALVADYAAARERLAGYIEVSPDLAELVREVLDESAASYAQGNVTGASDSVVVVSLLLDIASELARGAANKPRVQSATGSDAETGTTESVSQAAALLCSLQDWFSKDDVFAQAILGVTVAMILEQQKSASSEVLALEEVRLSAPASLLINGVRASEAAWRANVVGPQANARGLSASAFLDLVEDSDVNHAQCLATTIPLVVSPDATKWSASDAESVVYAMVGMWGLGVQEDIGFSSGGEDGETTYERDYVLQQMLDRARLKSAQEIGVCQQSGHACRRAALEFHRANGYRSGPFAEPMSALTSYWAASIFALLEQGES